MTISLDNFDRALLNLVQKNARMTAEAMAEQIGLSPASVHRRLKRLREEKVILSEVAILNSQILEKGMTFIVSVEVERERVDLLDAFRKDMKAHPEVQQCYYVTGETDFVLIIKVKDMDDYERFTKEAFFDNSNIRKFRTSVVMSEVKSGLNIPV